MPLQSPFTSKKKILSILAAIAVVVLAALIVVLRNRALFSLPNFYAEDATIFLDNVLRHPLTGWLTLFNGYLVIGQYALVYLAVLLHVLTGGSVAGISLAIAAVSTAFLAMCISLPYLLFRKELGAWLAILIVVVSAFVPMTNSSFAIIGTVGNLKFVFVYAAFLLILYRNLRIGHLAKPYVIDAVLLVCVLTNVTAIFLLPFALWPYRGDLLVGIRRRRWKDLAKNRELLSILILHAIAAIYVTAVYAHGIPKLPGYLDAPYQSAATLPIMDRATTYAWLYPITDTLRARVVIALWLVLTGLWWKFGKKDRFTPLFGLWAITIATLLFVMNRTGVSAYYLNYQHHGGPDQFFYAQNLIFIFITFWLFRDWFVRKDAVAKLLCTVAVGTFLLWAYPFGTTFGQARAVYQGLGTAGQDFEAACQSVGQTVHIQIYPSTAWKWNAPRGEVCEGAK